MTARGWGSIPKAQLSNPDSPLIIANSPFTILFRMWYQLLNIFFFIFHTVFTVFNMTGWIYKKTRKLHLITLSLTAFSWFVLGIWYGWGYCFCTDWHWAVREKLGFVDRSRSYIHFLILNLTGVNLDPQLVELVTGIVFLVSFILSIWLNIKNNSGKAIHPGSRDNQDQLFQ